MDLMPIHFKKKSIIVAVLQCKNRNGNYFETPADIYKLGSNRINKYSDKAGGAFGAWKLTSLIQDGTELIEIEDLRILISTKRELYRTVIKNRLDQMGAKRLMLLQPTQYKSFYNFLLTLTP